MKNQSDNLLWFLVVLFTLGILSMASLSLRNAQGLPDTPIIEDAYYSLTVARNIALGNGITIDGVMLTNGFQPLFTIIGCVPIYLLVGGDRVAALRGLYLLNTVVVLGTALILARIAYGYGRTRIPRYVRRLRAFLVATCYVSATIVTRFHYNGLETGFLMFMYSLAWLYYYRVGVDTFLRCAGLGALVGLVVLSRIDAAFFAVIAALGVSIVTPGSARVRVFRFLLVGGVSLLVSAPWWAFNLLEFGSLMPSSGQAEASAGVTAVKVAKMIMALSQVATPAMFIGRFEGLYSTFLRAAALFGSLLLLLAVRRRGADSRLDPADREAARILHFSYWLAGAYGLLVLYYLTQSGATWFFPRYLAPVSIFGVGLLVLVIELLLSEVKLVGIALILVLALQLPFHAYLHHTGRGFRGSTFYRDELSLVREHVPKDAVIASGQSGTLGYWRDRVVNCDGKVNAEALGHRENMQAYLDRRGIDWWIDTRLFDNADTRRWELVDDRGGHGLHWYLYKRIDRDDSAHG